MPQFIQSKFTGEADQRGSTSWRDVPSTVLQAARDFKDDGCLRLAAALSFYTMLSFAPLLLVVVGAAGYLGQREAIADQLVRQVENLVGAAGGEMARVVLENPEGPRKGAFALLVGLATLLFGATGVFAQLQTSLNIVWEVERRPGAGVVRFLRTRLISFAMVLAIGFLLLVSLVLSAAIGVMQSGLSSITEEQGWVWHSVDVGVSMLVVSTLFGLMYKLLPDVRIGWRDVIAGAVITGALMTVGKFLIGLYLGHSGVGSAYGAAGSLVVLLVWIYYSALIVLFGAELTQVYARRRGSIISPKAHARAIC